MRQEHPSRLEPPPHWPWPRAGLAGWLSLCSLGVAGGRACPLGFPRTVPTSQVVRSRPGPQSLTTHPGKLLAEVPLLRLRFVTTPSPQELSPARTSLFTSLSPSQTETPCDNHHHHLLHRRHGHYHISLARSLCSHGCVDLQRVRGSMLCDLPGQFKRHSMRTIAASQWSSTTPRS